MSYHSLSVHKGGEDKYGIGFIYAFNISDFFYELTERVGIFGGNAHQECIVPPRNMVATGYVGIYILKSVFKIVYMFRIIDGNTDECVYVVT